MRDVPRLELVDVWKPDEDSYQIAALDSLRDAFCSDKEFTVDPQRIVVAIVEKMCDVGSSAACDDEDLSRIDHCVERLEDVVADSHFCDVSITAFLQSSR